MKCKKRDILQNVAKQKGPEILQKTEKFQNHRNEFNESMNGATVKTKDQWQMKEKW